LYDLQKEVAWLRRIVSRPTKKLPVLFASFRQLKVELPKVEVLKVEVLKVEVLKVEVLR